MTVTATTSFPTSTILREPWRTFARVVWIILTTFAVIVAVIGTRALLADPYPSCTVAGTSCGPWIFSREDMALAVQLGLPVRLLSAALFTNSFLPRIVMLLVGLFIFWKKSDDWVALLLSLMLTGFVTEGVQNVGRLTVLVTIVYAAITAVYGLLPFIFPNGRIVPTRLRRLVPVVVLASTLTTLMPQLGIALTDQRFTLITMATFSVWFVVAGYAAIYRYRYVSTGVERQQTKWVVAGILGTFALFIPFTVIGVWFPPSQPSSQRLAFFFLVYLPIGLLSYLFIPIGIGFAILRYRLYDIDLIIRKTLQYALLSGLLALVYFGSVVLLQSAFDTVIGESPLLIVASTLLIAALFNPLRRRVQDIVDRRFYRKKYDAQQVLAQFAQTCRDETELERLSAELQHVIQDTLQPQRVTVWLRE